MSLVKYFLLQIVSYHGPNMPGLIGLWYFINFGGIWRARNNLIFKGKVPDNEMVALKIVAFFNEIGPWHPKAPSQSVTLVDLDGIFPICFFDGASIGGRCGYCVYLHINPSSLYHVFWSGRSGDNCRSEMIALWGALQCASWIGIEKVVIISDSLSIIQWIQGRCELDATNPRPKVYHT